MCCPRPEQVRSVLHACTAKAHDVNLFIALQTRKRPEGVDERLCRRSAVAIGGAFFFSSAFRMSLKIVIGEACEK